jgi:hypothetical protein
VVETTDPLPTSGVAWVLVVEYEYSEGTGEWWPVHPLQPTTNDWKPIGQFDTWNLLGIAGKRYLQVWVADNAGNISAPASAAIRYEPAGSEIENLPPEDAVPGTRLALPSTPRISDEVLRFFYLPLVGG